jgi:hypothetical protein
MIAGLLRKRRNFRAKFDGVLYDDTNYQRDKTRTRRRRKKRKKYVLGVES